MNANHRKYSLKIILSEEQKFYTAPDGLTKHQNWKGGYRDHVIEVMTIAVTLYKALSCIRQLSFTLSEALYASFLHDLEKMFNLGISRDDRPIRVTAKGKHESRDSFSHTVKILKRYHVVLPPKISNAIMYAHGEGDDYHPSKRIMNPLAAFVHSCDTISARIWFEYPKKKIRGNELKLRNNPKVIQIS